MHGFLYRKPAFSWAVSERLNKKAAPDLVLSRKSGKLGKYWLTYGKVCGILIKENREMLNTSPKAVHAQHRFPFHRKGSQPSFPAVFRPLPASCRAMDRQRRALHVCGRESMLFPRHCVGFPRRGRRGCAQTLRIFRPPPFRLICHCLLFCSDGRSHAAGVLILSPNPQQTYDIFKQRRLEHGFQTDP